ncbi:hypothetical protein CVT25_008114 [Psilocybe cyanescens]|uniref:Uncharacterized protein n=1 Tax=Psilocybe cyanescens TaxID=93625 RepID=A0A409X9E7_PSICY|nr:hypothetical protein CVT25_008114 [Psilocybe cyanescens]
MNTANRLRLSSTRPISAMATSGYDFLLCPKAIVAVLSAANSSRSRFVIPTARLWELLLFKSLAFALFLAFAAAAALAVVQLVRAPPSLPLFHQHQYHDFQEPNQNRPYQASFPRLILAGYGSAAPKSARPQSSFAIGACFAADAVCVAFNIEEDQPQYQWQASPAPAHPSITPSPCCCSSFPPRTTPQATPSPSSSPSPPLISAVAQTPSQGGPRASLNTSPPALPPAAEPLRVAPAPTPRPSDDEDYGVIVREGGFDGLPPIPYPVPIRLPLPLAASYHSVAVPDPDNIADKAGLLPVFAP